MSTLEEKTRESGIGQTTCMPAEQPLANTVTTFISDAEEVIWAQGSECDSRTGKLPMLSGPDSSRSAEQASASCTQRKAIPSPLSRQLGFWLDGEMYDHVASAEDTSNLFKREAAIYEVLGSHPCILKCIGVELMPGREEAWALRLERVPHGNLQEYIGKNEPPTMTRRLQVAVDFTEALQYVHDRGVIWGDVSPRNVLVFDGLHIKLCDFAGSILKDKFPELLFTCEPRY
ncbi:hypothetical protein LZL87_003341 [Fusarium oxysporum]|nr:hypothetical protein LZL87_003341 [Fusarium oxysporum]